MSPTGLASGAVVLAYLIGAIPFAYVIVRALKGIDIRTVGSGNVGATNAGRVLGVRGFFAIFLLDLLKGLLPTILLPMLVTRFGGRRVADLSVLVALATIMGHNFPIYLNFKGGKGVATSLGALLGLDWMASVAAAVIFLVSLKTNRYISLSSALGATAFVVVHFAGVHFLEGKSAWDRDHIALSVLTVGLFVMLIWRHRKNWGRIMEGTEPKLTRRPKAPSGRAAIVLVLAIAILGGASLVWSRLSRTATLDCGAFTLVDLGRVKTGHQRAFRPVFADGGRVLGVLCPRYNRLMIYRVTETRSLDLAQDVTLSGQPMDLGVAGDRFLVLERPSGDTRHIKPGYVQAYRFDGAKVGEAVAVGFYPTGMTLTKGGRRALVLTAGRAEGNARLAPPALEVIDVAAGRVVSHVDFDHPGDLPTGISVSSAGQAVAVTLRSSKEVAALDLADPSHPRVLGRTKLSPRDSPYPSISGDDWVLMPVDSDRECALLGTPGQRADAAPSLAGYLLSVQVDDSDLEVRKLASATPLGRLPLRGSGNLGTIRPTGVACSSERGLVAVTSRSGGVHLVEIRAKGDQVAPQIAAREAPEKAVR